MKKSKIINIVRDCESYLLFIIKPEPELQGGKKNIKLGKQLEDI